MPASKDNPILISALRTVEHSIDQVMGEHYAIKNPALVAHLVPIVLPMLELQQKYARLEADKGANDRDYLELAQRYNALEKQMKDGISCCCAGCSKHNQDLGARQ